MEKAETQQPSQGGNDDRRASPSSVTDSPQQGQSVARIEDGESEWSEAHLERLGRERPAKFSSLSKEIGFVFSVVMSQVLVEYFVSGFSVILPPIVSGLGISKGATTWPANAFSLVVSAFMLPLGRVADMYGGYPVYVAGTAWLALWALIAGFSQNELMIILCRALQGLGPAAFLPSGLMLLGSTYRPGPRKNLVFSIYGACAPLGFFVGIFFAGIAAEYASWNWYFWIGAILGFITAVVAYFTIPSDVQERKGLDIKMDWLGAGLTSVGLILVVYAITDSSHAPNGWKTPYIPALLVLGVTLLLTAVYVEGWKAEMPLLPAELFKVKYMTPLLLAVFFSFGTLGVFLLYTTYYMTEIMGATPIQLVAWFAPMAIGGCIISTLGGFVLHIIPGTVLLVLAGVAWIVAPLLFAIAPEGANYWAYVFPSMICATIGIDVTFNITNIFITTSLPLRRQGLGGALVNSMVQLGIAFLLGFADVVAKETADKGPRLSYKAVLWYETGCAAFALILLVGFVRLDRAKSALTADEKKAMQEAESGRASR